MITTLGVSFGLDILTCQSYVTLLTMWRWLTDQECSKVYGIWIRIGCPKIRWRVWNWLCRVLELLHILRLPHSSPLLCGWELTEQPPCSPVIFENSIFSAQNTHLTLKNASSNIILLLFHIYSHSRSTICSHVKLVDCWTSKNT